MKNYCKDFHPTRKALFLLLISTLAAYANPVQWDKNKHFYEYVPFGETQLTWEEANSIANSKTYNGWPGHLVTITSKAENQFVETNLTTGLSDNGAWAGGQNSKEDGYWIWVAGPDAGTAISYVKTAEPPYNYANWGGIEPNHNNAGEKYLVFNVGQSFSGIETGQWWDAVNTPSFMDPVGGYIVEYEPVSPILGIETNVDNTLAISWYNYPNATLQETSGNFTNWTSTTNSVALTNDKNIVIIDKTNNPFKFYRLIQ